MIRTSYLQTYVFPAVHVQRVTYTATMYATLAEALTARQRSEGDLTDREVAELLSSRESTYSRWRNGDMVPRDHQAPRLAAYLGLSLDEMYALLGRSRSTRSGSAREGFVSRSEFEQLKSTLDLVLERLDDLAVDRHQREREKRARAGTTA